MVDTITKPKTDPRVNQLRMIFRNLHAFRSEYEASGLQEITGPDGVTWSLWDLEKLYNVAVKTNLLPLRQRQSIELFLVLNLPESEVAIRMGILPSNPVGMYASSGLVKLLREMDTGNIPSPWKNEYDYE